MKYNYSVREGELLQINSRKAKMVIRFAVDGMYSAGFYFCHLRFGGDLGDLPLLQ